MKTLEESLDFLRTKKGIVATVVTSGKVEDAFAWSLMEMRSWCDRNDFHAVEWRPFDATLVDHGRNEILKHTLKEGYDWCLQIDADASPIPPQALARILYTAFVSHPDADVVGAYAQLKAPPFLPTIDTGTGTWEPHYPGEGVLSVIRTGAHFILVKPSILHRFGPPWFGLRTSMKAADAIAEVDNYARIKLDGRNPFAEMEEWETLTKAAREEGGGAESPVGEDSGFCDAVKAAGGAIYVDTNLVIGHVGKRGITPKMLKEAMDEREDRYRAAVGIVSR